METVQKKGARRTWVLVVTGAVTVVLGALVFVGQDPSASVVWSERDRSHGLLAYGQQAPDFTLPDAQGQEISLRALKGRPLLLAFVSAGCPFCQKLFGQLDSLALPSDRHVVVVCRGTASEAEGLARAHTFPYPVVADSAGATHQAYKVSGVPTVYRLDERGRIRGARGGWPTAWELMVQ